MLRYTKLLAGASWIEEYGDPEDPKMREYLKSYSPYHQVKPKKNYPEAFFMTSTSDDRVHPGHARKMAKKMRFTVTPKARRRELVGVPFLFSMARPSP